MTARRLGALLTVVAVLATPGIASAAGGDSIANAPTVAPGQQQFGNTANVGDPTRQYYVNEFWKLQLLAGDEVTINWEVDPSAQVELQVYPPGTDDFTLGNTRYSFSQRVTSNYKNQVNFRANKSGVWPLCFQSYRDWPGPYDFVVYVKRAVTVALAPQTRSLIASRQLPRKGRLVILARNPDGAAITDPGLGAIVYAYWAKTWHRLAAATVRNGTVTLDYRLPPSLRGRIRLNIALGGSNYQGSNLIFKGIAINK